MQKNLEEEFNALAFDSNIIFEDENNNSKVNHLTKGSLNNIH